MSPEVDAVVHRRVVLYTLPVRHQDGQVWDDADGYHNDDDDDDYDDDDDNDNGDDDDADDDDDDDKMSLIWWVSGDGD